MRRLKIFIIGSMAEGSLANTFAKEFSLLGHEVFLFDAEQDYRFRLNNIPFSGNSFFKRIVNLLLYRLIAKKTNKKILKKFYLDKPNLVLVFKGWEVSPNTVKKIKKRSKIFCFTGDDPLDKKRFSDSNSWIRKSIPLYDSYFIWAKSLVKELKKNGAAHAHYLPVAYDKDLHFPVKCKDKEKKIYGAEVSFIGTWTPDREEWLNELKDFDLKIWGNMWENANIGLQKKWTKKEAIGNNFSKVCNCSKIMINFVRKPRIPSHNMRTFEIPACKGFQLSNRTNEVLSFLKEGKEIACFDSKKEMVEKVNYYLKNESERKEIINNSYKKIKSESYSERAKNILTEYKSML